MLYYERIDKSEGTDPTKSNKSNKCMIMHVFKIQDSVCNGRHDLTMFCLAISDIVIITVKTVILHFLFSI